MCLILRDNSKLVKNHPSEMGGMDGGMFISLIYMLLGYVIEEWFLSSFVSHHSQTGGMIKFDEAIYISL